LQNFYYYCAVESFTNATQEIPTLLQCPKMAFAIGGSTIVIVWGIFYETKN